MSVLPQVSSSWAILIGAGESQERGVVGETPNLAARLQTLAEPDCVVIDANTQQLTSGIFEYEELGDGRAKGLCCSQWRAWRVRGESAIESRFEALHSAAALTRLSGARTKSSCWLGAGSQAKSGCRAGDPAARASRALASRA